MSNRNEIHDTADKPKESRPDDSTQERIHHDTGGAQLKTERTSAPAYEDKRQLSPCADQTKADIEKWLRANVAMGTEVAVRETQGNTLSYSIIAVDYLGKGRFGVGSCGTFYYSGKNCRHPKGQTRLVIPTSSVREFIQKHPCGCFSLGADGYQVKFY